MARSDLTLAIALSLALHGVATLVLVSAPRWPWPTRDDVLLALPDLPSARLPDDAVAAIALAPATEIELRAPGDADRATPSPSAPSDAPNPDARDAVAAPSGGAGAGAPVRVTDRADGVELRAQPFDAERGYQVQRIRSDDERQSREDVRATPHPALSPWLATRDGDGHARHLPSLNTPSENLTRAIEPERGRVIVPARVAELQSPPSTPDPAGIARPWLLRDPASTDGASQSEDVSDRVDAPLVSDAREPQAFEMARPTSPGKGDAATGDAALGYAPSATGTAPVPAGAPNQPRGPLQPATYQRQYDLYVSRVKQKVDPLWTFPRDLALQLEQGDLLVAFTIARDGRLKDLRLIKRSGFPSFDKNVLAAIKKAAPFDPLPASLGSELRVTAPFAGGSPAIR